MVKGIALERKGDTIRGIILVREEDGCAAVLDIYEVDVDNADNMWALIEEHNPDLGHVYHGQQFVDVEFLSVREAAEILFPEVTEPPKFREVGIPYFRMQCGRYIAALQSVRRGMILPIPEITDRFSTREAAKKAARDWLHKPGHSFSYLAGLLGR